jgi:hypothetical protein
MDSDKHCHLAYVSITTKLLVAADGIRNESQLRNFIHLECKSSIAFRINKKGTLRPISRFFLTSYEDQKKYIRLAQGCTNPGRQVAVAT